MTERIKCIVAYDGAQFFGYQIQPNKRTVQGELEKALEKIHDTYIRIHASGRTDTGVHSKGQVFHFDTELNLPVYGWQRAINSNLPEDVNIIQVEKVAPDFHSRFDAIKKEYRYLVSIKKERDVFTRNYVYHYPYKVDREKMQAAANCFIGTYDFTHFSSARSDVEDKVRTIFDLQVNQKGDDLEIVFIGNGFLYNMVRILTGVILEAGQDRVSIGAIQSTLSGKRGKLRTKTAPGHGLYLWSVDY